MADDRIDHEPWPLRALLLLVAGAACGLAFDLLTRDHGSDYGWAWTESVARISLAVSVAAGFALLAFTLEHVRWRWSLAFAIGAGLVIGGIYYWNGSPEQHGTDDFLRFFVSLLSIAIAAPLFQTMRDEGARRLPYVAVHGHSWTNVVLWCAAWGFVLVSWLLAMLLGELFSLIGIDLIKEALRKSWFTWMLVGGTFGAAVGLLRDRDKVLGLLQRVVTTVLSVLAPVLAIGLVLFVLALPFTGLDVLWDKTEAPTPVTLACVVGAIILANAVIGNASSEEARGPVLRWSAMALGAVLLPLVAVAAISTALRIGQYGFTPSRLWGVVAVAVAAAYALFYLYALVRGRAGWAERVRPANIKLAIGVCALALLLATPLAQFGAISTRSQLARIESAQVPPAEFDWRAMRFDFGGSGVRALERLKGEGSAEQRRYAAAALRARFPWDIASPEVQRRQRQMPHNIRYLPSEAAVPPALREVVLAAFNCTGDEHCALYHQPGADRAFLISPSDCRASAYPAGMRGGACEPAVIIYYRNGDSWTNEARAQAGSEGRHARMTEALRRGDIEIRTVPRQQIFVGGEPVSADLD